MDFPYYFTVTINDLTVFIYGFPVSFYGDRKWFNRTYLRIARIL